MYVINIQTTINIRGSKYTAQKTKMLLQDSKVYNINYQMDKRQMTIHSKPDIPDIVGV